MSTPTATLGIRGTVFDVFVRNGGSTVVILRNGQVVVNGLAGGTEVLTQPGLASVINTGSAPSKPTTPPADVLDYLRGILPSIPDNVTWERQTTARARMREPTLSTSLMTCRLKFRVMVPCQVRRLVVKSACARHHLLLPTKSLPVLIR